MSGVLAVPFLHIAWLIAAALGAWCGRLLLPERGWRLPVALALGVAFACILAAARVVPMVGQLHLAWYGLFMLSGFVLAYLLLQRRARLIGIDERSTLIDMVLVALLGGLVGARLRYVWERSDQFLFDAQHHHRSLTDAVANMVDFDSGGMVWYGGLTLATLAVLLVVLRDRVRVLAAADLIAPALLAGLAVGRIGCFVNGCCYGRPTDMPWAVRHLTPQGATQWVHPTQLYETLVCGLLAAGLWWLWRRRRVDGAIAAIGVVGYSIWRFINEGLRGDDRIPSTWLGTPGPGVIDKTRIFSLPLDTSQVTSCHLVVITLVAALAVVLWRRAHPQAQLAAHQVPGSIHAPAPAPAVLAAASSPGPVLPTAPAGG